MDFRGSVERPGGGPPSVCSTLSPCPNRSSCLLSLPFLRPPSAPFSSILSASRSPSFLFGTDRGVLDFNIFDVRFRRSPALGPRSLPGAGRVRPGGENGPRCTLWPCFSSNSCGLALFMTGCTGYWIAVQCPLAFGGICSSVHRNRVPVLECGFESAGQCRSSSTFLPAAHPTHIFPPMSNQQPSPPAFQYIAHPSSPLVIVPKKFY